jgi:hypothetical protein
MRKIHVLAATTFAGLLFTLTGCGASGASMKPPSAPSYAEAAPAYGGASVDADDAPMTASAPPPAAAGGAAPRAPVTPASYHPQAANATPPPAPAASKSSGAAASGNKEANKDASNPAVLIMYTGALSMTIDEAAVPGAIDKMVDIAENFGGHLAGRTNTTVTVKVPSGRFRDALAEMEKLGMVTNRSVSAEDVSEEYKDAEVRLANMKATRTRIQEFLAKAANVNDMLTLEQQLERVSLEIDRIEGRMRFLRERTALSTITVSVTPKPKPVPILAKDPDPPPPPPPPPPPQPPTAIELPVKWLDQLGSDRLMQVKK